MDVWRGPLHERWADCMGQEERDMAAFAPGGVLQPGVLEVPGNVHHHREPEEHLPAPGRHAP